MGYLDNSGLSYFWGKIKALFGKMEVTTDSASGVGTAIVGTAVTVAPNYTPGGDITVPELDYEFKDGKLYIYGIKQPKFVGSGVKLILKENDE